MSGTLRPVAVEPLGRKVHKGRILPPTRDQFPPFCTVRHLAAEQRRDLGVHLLVGELGDVRAGREPTRNCPQNFRIGWNFPLRIACRIGLVAPRRASRTRWIPRTD